MIEKERVIFFVDDEPAVRKAVVQTLESLEGCMVVSFEDAQCCLDKLKTEECDLLITDVNMPDIDGLELLDRLRTIRPLLPVLLVTGYGDIPMAVHALKSGATDFIEKPLDENTFLPVVQQILQDNTFEDVLHGRPLTKTETNILIDIAKGMSNKEIAFGMRRSVRTIENHRYNIMRKLNAESILELYKTAESMGLTK